MNNPTSFSPLLAESLIVDFPIRPKLVGFRDWLFKNTRDMAEQEIEIWGTRIHLNKLQGPYLSGERVFLFTVGGYIIHPNGESQYVSDLISLVHNYSSRTIHIVSATANIMVWRYFVELLNKISDYWIESKTSIQEFKLRIQRIYKNPLFQESNPIIADMVNEVTFLVNSSPKDFTNWIGKRTLSLTSREFQTETGKLLLQRSSPGEVIHDPQQIVISGFYLKEKQVETGEIIIEYLPLTLPPFGAIEFTFSSYADGRTKINAICNIRVVSILKYFHELLQDIAANFPEAKHDLQILFNQTDGSGISDISLHTGAKFLERREKVRKLFKQGNTVKQIASNLYCSESTIKRDLKVLRLTRKRRIRQSSGKG